jgi:hypothetical protein
LFTGCDIFHYGIAIFGYTLSIVNESGSNLTDIKVLFLNMSIQSLDFDKDYTLRVSRGPKGQTSQDVTPDIPPDGAVETPIFSDEYEDIDHVNVYKGPNHLEYKINGTLFTSNCEQGDFAGEDIIITGPILLITVYADYFTMEVKDYDE